MPVAAQRAPRAQSPAARDGFLVGVLHWTSDDGVGTPEGSWRGRPARLVDGTTLSMADTQANQAALPQPTTQKPGLGFPISPLLALFCLSSGAVLDAAICAYQGKGNDEQTLLRSLLDRLEPASISWAGRRW